MGSGVLARFVALVLGALALTGCSLIAPFTPPRPTALPLVPQIAFVGSDDQVYVAEADGSSARQLTRRVGGVLDNLGWTYRWPTYSPDGRHVAFAGYHAESGRLVSTAVLSAQSDQTEALALLESTELAPIYLYWSPDNRHLTVLFQREAGLELHLLDSAGTEPARRLITGQPLYWSWAPDGRVLAVHVGGDAQSSDDAWVGLLHVGENDAREERFSDAPGGFRAPAWAPAGNGLAYVGLGGGLSVLSVRDAAGNVNRLATSPTDIAFNWSPGGEWVAFSAQVVGTPLYQGLEVARPDGKERHRLVEEPLAGFFWAPDGNRLAVLGIDMASRQLVWSTVQVDGQGRRTLDSFVPSSDFAFQLPFFDQFAQSTSVWSPDGRKLVYATEGGSARQNGSVAGERVMVLDVAGQTPHGAVARGSVGVWSPARER
jgi:TolB protein